MRYLRAIFGVLGLVLATFFCAPAQAQTPPAAPGAATVQGAIEAYFSPESDAEAARIFRAANLDLRRLLVAHRLLMESALLVEVELAHGATALRYPLRLEDTSPRKNGTRWRVDWAPDVAYARALVQAAAGGELAQSGAGQPWSQIQRLPAFGIIVGADFFVTPFGRIEDAPAAEDAAPGGGLRPAPQLHKHAQRWTGMLLFDDPGSANVDVILRTGVSWERVTQAVLPAAMVGLARIYLVSTRDGAPLAFSLVAPVLKQVISGASTRVIGVTPVGQTGADPRYRVRVRVGEKQVEKTAGASGQCPGEATFCATSDDDFAAQLGALAPQLKAAEKTSEYVLFAASAGVPAEVMLKFMARAYALLELPVGKMLLGYIAAEEVPPAK